MVTDDWESNISIKAVKNFPTVVRARNKSNVQKAYLLWKFKSSYSATTSTFRGDMVSITILFSEKLKRMDVKALPGRVHKCSKWV